MNVKKYLIGSLLILLITLILPAAGIWAQDFPRVCLEDPANLMPNCKFDNGLDGWQPFLEDGAAALSYLQGGGECHAPQCPAAYIVTESNFVGGIYQQVPVVAGNTYYANINWLVFDSYANDASVNSAVGSIGRRVGIDPFGGTDSRSSNVIWGPDNWRTDCKTCQVEYAIATAQADTITVFVRIDDRWRQRAAEKGFTVPFSKDQFWLDEIGLKQISGDAAPAQPVEAPTDTPVPTTDTPVPATNTPAPAADAPKPTATPTATAAEIAQVEEPVSPVETPTATNTLPPPPPTLTPTTAPSPTNTALPRPTRPPAPTRASRSPSTTQSESNTPMLLGAVGTTVCLGGVGLLLVAVVIAGLVWLYRLGWSRPKDTE